MRTTRMQELYNSLGSDDLTKQQIKENDIFCEIYKNISTRKNDAVDIVYSAVMKRGKRINRKTTPVKKIGLEKKLEDYKLSILAPNLNKFKLNGNLSVKFGPEFMYEKIETADWNYYSKSYGHPKVFRNVYITVKNDMSIRQIREYGLLDGIPTVEIMSEKTFGNINLVHAKIACYDKSKNVYLKKQYIAICSEFAYHADTAKKAVSGIQRKMKKALELSEPITLETKITRKRYAELTGACMAGIIDFCNRHGLSDKKSIKLLDLMPVLENNNAFGINAIRKMLKN